MPRFPLMILALVVLAASPALAQVPDFAATGSSDPSLAYMQQIFGGDLFAGGSGPSSTVLAEYAKMMNSVVVAVGAVFMTWQIVAGTMQSAHEGEVLGRQWSSLWAPIRLAVAGAGMIPLPSGYCAVQMLTATLITTGVSAGSWIYGQTIDKVMTGTPISARVTPDYSGLAPDIWDMLICQHAINVQHSVIYGTPALGIPRPVRVGNAVVYGSPVQNAQGGADELSCGTIALDMSGHTAGLAQAHQAGLNALIAGLDPIAQRVAIAAYPGASQAPVFPTAGEIANAVKSAERTLSDAIVAAMATNAPAETAATLTAMKSGGWLWAGTWYNQIARQNERFAEEASRLPAYQHSPERLAIAQDIEFLRVQKAALQLISVYSNPASAGYKPNITNVNNGKATDEPGIVARVSEKLARFNADLQGHIFSYFTPSKGKTGFVSSGAESPVHRLTVFGVVLFNMAVSAALVIGLASMAADTKVLGFGLSLGTFFASPGGAVINTAILGLVACGAFLGYILPLLPYAIWMTAVVAYFVLAAEAIIAGPLWAFAHLKMGGDGLHGQAGAGYIISFNLLMRPTLMIGGLFAGMAIAAVGVGLVAETFIAAVIDDVKANSNALTVGTTALTAPATMLLSTAIRLGFFVALTVVICERSFALVHKLPDAISRWIGGQGEALGENETGDRIRAAAMLTKQTVVNAAGQGRDTGGRNHGNSGGDGEGGNGRRFRGAGAGAFPSSGSAPSGASSPTGQSSD